MIPDFVQIHIYHQELPGLTAEYGYMKEEILSKEYQETYKIHHHGSFYSINPELPTVPPYMAQMVVENDTNYPGNIKKIFHKYDPYKDYSNSLTILVWITPFPFTTPLYLYDLGNTVFPSFELHGSKKQVDFSPIYVLRDSPDEHTIWPNETDRRWFKNTSTGIDFRFVDNMGKCIPEPGGETLGQCLEELRKTKARPRSLLEYIQNENRRQIEHEKRKLQNPKFLIQVFLVILATLLGLFTRV